MLALLIWIWKSLIIWIGSLSTRILNEIFVDWIFEGSSPAGASDRWYLNFWLESMDILLSLRDESSRWQVATLFTSGSASDTIIVSSRNFSCYCAWRTTLHCKVLIYYLSLLGHIAWSSLRLGQSLTRLLESLALLSEILLIPNLGLDLKLLLFFRRYHLATLALRLPRSL